MDEEVLGRCHAILFNSLDTSLISPLLYSNKLLTSNEYDMLESPIRSHSDKIRSLLSILPGKDQWFDKFLDCLKETSDGTGHCKIVRELEHAKRDIENRKKG